LKSSEAKKQRRKEKKLQAKHDQQRQTNVGQHLTNKQTSTTVTVKKDDHEPDEPVKEPLDPKLLVKVGVLYQFFR